MKVKTNLSACELETVGAGLVALAKGQQVDKIPAPENEAESGIVSNLLECFDVMLDSLQDDIVDILGDKK